MSRLDKFYCLAAGALLGVGFGLLGHISLRLSLLMFISAGLLLSWVMGGSRI